MSQVPLHHITKYDSISTCMIWLNSHLWIFLVYSSSPFEKLLWLVIFHKLHQSNMLLKGFDWFPKTLRDWNCVDLCNRKQQKTFFSLSSVPHLYPPTFPTVHQPSPLELKVLGFCLYSPHWEMCLCWLIAVWSLLMLLPANFSLSGFLQPAAAWVWGFLAVIVRYLLLIG